MAPATPAFLPPLAADLPRNRLGLARWLLAPENPLTARVTVNRLWEQLFGVGLVETPEDWGIRSKVPQHLDLLDTHSEIAGIFENVPEEFGPVGQITGKLGEQLEELGFMGYEPHGFPPTE